MLTVIAALLVLVLVNLFAASWKSDREKIVEQFERERRLKRLWGRGPTSSARHT